MCRRRADEPDATRCAPSCCSPSPSRNAFFATPKNADSAHDEQSSSIIATFERDSNLGLGLSRCALQPSARVGGHLETPARLIADGCSPSSAKKDARGHRTRGKTHEPDTQGKDDFSVLTVQCTLRHPLRRNLRTFDSSSGSLFSSDLMIRIWYSECPMSRPISKLSPGEAFCFRSHVVMWVKRYSLRVPDLSCSLLL